MTAYFSTFASGLQEIIQQTLSRQLSDARILRLMDGLVLYESERPLQQITAIPYFNNTFILVHFFDKLPGGGLQYMMQTLMKKPDLVRIPHWTLKKARSFRLMASQENQTIAIQRSLLERLESFFSHRLNLRVNRSKADVELWFIERSEGCGLLGLRVTKSSASPKTLQKGELRPEMTHILCLLSDPAKNDHFLDPFAGSGAIPLERAKSFAYQHITAADNDAAIAAALRKRLPVSNKLSVLQADALHLDAISADSIDKIVTDPPWGFFDGRKSDDLQEFYTAMLAEFLRILKPNGLLIVLMGQKERFENALASCSASLQLLGKWDILVSGKKTAIYKIQKRAD